MLSLVAFFLVSWLLFLSASTVPLHLTARARGCPARQLLSFPVVGTENCRCVDHGRQGPHHPGPAGLLSALLSVAQPHWIFCHWKCFKVFVVLGLRVCCSFFLGCPRPGFQCGCPSSLHRDLCLNILSFQRTSFPYLVFSVLPEVEPFFVGPGIILFPLLSHLHTGRQPACHCTLTVSQSSLRDRDGEREEQMGQELWCVCVTAEVTRMDLTGIEHSKTSAEVWLGRGVQ